MTSAAFSPVPAPSAEARSIVDPAYALLAVVAGTFGFVGTRVTSYVTSLSLAPGRTVALAG